MTRLLRWLELWHGRRTRRWNARHHRSADDDSRHVVGPDMRAGEQWADAALVLTIEPIHQEEA